MPNNVDYVLAVSKIQSFWRAHRTCKQLNEVHTCYADVMESIDGQRPTYPSASTMKLSVLKRPSLVQADRWCTNLEATSRNLEDDVETDTATSIESEKSHCECTIPEEDQVESAETLLDAKQHVAMELLWIQIAIESRRNYLQVKQKLADNDNSS